jgi:hypothetical protein
MAKYLLILGLLSSLSLGEDGRLNVQADQAGLRVYLDHDMIGVTPIVGYPVAPGDYWVSLFDPDSTEEQYPLITSGGIGQKLNSVWYLAKVEKGTKRISVVGGQTLDVFLSMKQAEQAPTQAKLTATACAAAPFALGVLFGVLVMLLANSGH